METQSLYESNKIFNGILVTKNKLEQSDDDIKTRRYALNLLTPLGSTSATWSLRLGLIVGIRTPQSHSCNDLKIISIPLRYLWI